MANRLNLKLLEEAERHRKQGRPLGESVLDYKIGVDTSSDTVTEETLLEGYTAHDAGGKQITGKYRGGGGFATSTVRVVSNRVVSVGFTAISTVTVAEK